MRTSFGVCAVALLTWPALAQHLAPRKQWQPRVMAPDPRLEQTFSIEILGRAAVPALEMLSEATGVSLDVAPENLDTVGERKLTIVAKDLRLKALMLRIPEALQECHWDIDDSGEEPVYLLHRNAGVERLFRSFRGKRGEMPSDIVSGPSESAAHRGQPSGERRLEQPDDPDLLQTVAIGSGPVSDLAELQRLIAEEADLSLVSDYFVSAKKPRVPAWARGEVALWRLLDALAADGANGQRYAWEKVGRCLVFRHTEWIRLVRREVPESLILEFRSRLESQGELTLEDIADLAAALAERGLSASHLPDDLRSAGIPRALDSSGWALLLYSSLSDEQRAKVRTPEGLPFDEMTPDQQRLVRDGAHGNPFTSGQAPLATFHLVTYARQTPRHRYRQTMLELRFPAVTDEALLRLERIREQ